MFDRKLGLVWNVFMVSIFGGFIYGFHHMKYVTERSYQLNDHPEIKELLDEFAEKYDNNGKKKYVKQIQPQDYLKLHSRNDPKL